MKSKKLQKYQILTNFQKRVSYRLQFLHRKLSIFMKWTDFKDFQETACLELIRFQRSPTVWCTCLKYYQKWLKWTDFNEIKEITDFIQFLWSNALTRIFQMNRFPVIFLQQISKESLIRFSVITLKFSMFSIFWSQSWYFLTKAFMEQISVFGDIDFPENEQICNFIDWSIFCLEQLEQNFPCRKLYQPKSIPSICGTIVEVHIAFVYPL